MVFSGSKRMLALICLALALATIGVYWRVGYFDFVNFDDPDYVTENTAVKSGLSFSGIVWAFTHVYASNWHPLTWISHMLDCQLFKLNPRGPHLVNVFFHTCNAIFLFLLLHRLTRAQWSSAFVAAVFALHPLHVESVAWISERKDVLSAFFGLLSLLFYVAYVNEAKAGNPKAKIKFWLALGLFALGLLAKPMLVTLPFLALLLDFWPLQRVENSGYRTFFTRNFGKLIAEKWPWFVLVVGSCVATLIAQRHATVTTKTFPLGWRLVNVIEAYYWYVEKTFWPTKLAVFYPLDQVRPIVPFIIAALVVTIVTIVAVANIRRWPYVFTGWFWFLGSLVPVIGIVQVGAQAMADRYSYVPMVGILIAFVWGTHGFLVHSPGKVKVAGAVAAAVLVLLAITTELQIRYWKNSITLFSRDLSVTRANGTALVNLGMAFLGLGRNEDAVNMYRLAVEINPDDAKFHNDFAVALVEDGKKADALPQYQQAVQLEPSNAKYQNNLATALLRAGDGKGAMDHYRAAIRLDPKFAEPYSNLGALLYMGHEYGEAALQYSEAIRLSPTNSGIRFNAGLAYLKAHRGEDAKAQFNEAARLRPDWAEPLNAEAWALATSNDAQMRNAAEAVRLAEKAAELTAHQQPMILNTLAAAYAEAGRFDDALTTANRALELSKQSNRTSLTAKIERAIALYQSHTPFRDNSE
jgi:protein O-mannosyl-transferase